MSDNYSLYKGIEVSQDIIEYIKYIPSLQDARETLQLLEKAGIILPYSDT